METRNPEEQRGEDSSLQEETAAEHEQEQADGLHQTSIADTQPLTEARFFTRLRAELALRGLDYAALPKYTVEGGNPPCMKALGVTLGRWAEMASHLGATVPYRLDMPAEPNYCVDCTRQLRDKAVKKGVCLFPNTRFEASRTSETVNGKVLIEYEIVGVSRSKEVAIEQAQEASLLNEVM